MSNATPKVDTETSTDLAFILDLFKNSNLPFERKDSVWSKDGSDTKTVLTIELPFPKKVDSDEPTATMEWIFKGEEIQDMNVYAQPGPPPEPLNPPESSFMADFAARLGKPTQEAPDKTLGYFR